MTDRTRLDDTRKNSGDAANGARVDRPATAPAHYLGVPAEVWMTVFRHPRARGKSTHRG
jgi:hypothetical protein